MFNRKIVGATPLHRLVHPLNLLCLVHPLNLLTMIHLSIVFLELHLIIQIFVCLAVLAGRIFSHTIPTSFNIVSCDVHFLGIVIFIRATNVYTI
jgi:hypothetical protein